MKYVLTWEQLKLAIYHGLAAADLIDEIHNHPVTEKTIAGLRLTDLEITQNGAVVDLDPIPGVPEARIFFLNEQHEQHETKGARTTAEPETRVDPQPAQAEDEVDYKALQTELGAHMAKPPGLRTIKAWSQSQLKQAQNWAKAKSKGRDVTRPSFIHEPAPRTRRQAVEEPSREQHEHAEQVVTSDDSVQTSQTMGEAAPSASVSDFYG